MNWNFSEAVYQIAHSDLCERPALIHDNLSISYGEVLDRCLGIASWLSTLGLPAGSHVGHYMRNSNAYLEAIIGSGLVGMSHVNVNYRYLDDELIALCTGLDIRVLVYDTKFAPLVAQIRQRCDRVLGYVEVGAEPPRNDFAVSMQALYSFDHSALERQTSPDDLILIATGGTTGLPKGTQWRHEDLWRKMEVCRGPAMAALELEEHPATLAQHIRNVASLPQPGPVFPLSPLMHATGLLIALRSLVQGAAVVTHSGARFDAGRTLDLIAQHRVGELVIVGDAFALPLLDELHRRGDGRALEPLGMIVSSGAILSDDSKAGLQQYGTDLLIIDALGSSESVGFGIATEEAGVFLPMPTTRVLDDELRDVRPGSETIGIAYSGGYVPIGYYNEPEKSAETFIELDGIRYTKTGDRCSVREDGMLVLLGRDSTVINTGGEKVYTVEVERILLDYPPVTDAIVVGLPHPRFGKMVVAVIEGPDLQGDEAESEAIKAFARGHLADYKVPRHIFRADSLRRAANGKPDYPFVEQFAASRLPRT